MERILTRWMDIPELRRLEIYEANGGYQALRKALFDMTPEQIVNEVKSSNLRGRGGAAFPTGVKWSFISKNSKKPVYVCCNADESEPGTFSNRYLIENDPHALIEGILIACRAVNSHTCYFYIRGEFAVQRCFEQALKEARAKGYIGADVMGSGFGVEIWVHRGAGAYICGEETGLLESLEGKRAYPRNGRPSRRSREHSDARQSSITSRPWPTSHRSSHAVRTGIDRLVPKRARGRSCSACQGTSTDRACTNCPWVTRSGT